MPTPLQSKWTIRKLLLNTKKYFPNRYDNMKRDVIKALRISKVHVYDSKEPGQARTLYRIKSQSYPQYSPYYIGKDKRGRPIKYQRTYKHQYDVTIQLDRLSIDVPFKGRTGSDKKWRFEKSARAKTIGKGRRKRLIESKNVKLGINGDFFFRCEWVWKKAGILYGRNWTNGAPKKTNPKKLVFADKHMLNTIRVLMDQGILQEG